MENSREKVPKSHSDFGAHLSYKLVKYKLVYFKPKRNIIKIEQKLPELIMAGVLLKKLDNTKCEVSSGKPTMSLQTGVPKITIHLGILISYQKSVAYP